MPALRQGYSVIQIMLHWLIALLVLNQLIFGESMKTAVDAAERGNVVSPADQFLSSSHYWSGIAILALVIVRLLIRATRGVPTVPVGTPFWMQRSASWSHALFYVLLVASPVLGLMAFYWGDPWGDLHTLSKPIFIVLILLHVAAALFHQFWLRDGLLRRILVAVR